MQVGKYGANSITSKTTVRDYVHGEIDEGS